MTVVLRVVLFCEDNAHEASARALVRRIAEDEEVEVTLRVGSDRLGIPRLRRELRAFQALQARSSGRPDLLIVLIDANRVGPRGRRTEIEELLDRGLVAETVVGTPDPCIERWLLADDQLIASRYGRVVDRSRSTNRRIWKQRLVQILEAAGEVVTQGGAEFAEELLGSMDLQRAAVQEPTLGDFVADLRSAVRRLKLARRT